MFKWTELQKKRSFTLLFSLSLLGLAVVLIVRGISQGAVFFYTPTDLCNLTESQIKPLNGRTIRLGGLVKIGSVTVNNHHSEFVITDLTADIALTYDGILPDLFRESQGVVVDVVFSPREMNQSAKQVFAKHDENYLPPEVAKTMGKDYQYQDKLINKTLTLDASSLVNKPFCVLSKTVTTNE